MRWYKKCFFPNTPFYKFISLRASLILFWYFWSKRGNLFLQSNIVWNKYSLFFIEKKFLMNFPSNRLLVFFWLVSLNLLSWHTLLILVDNPCATACSLNTVYGSEEENSYIIMGIFAIWWDKKVIILYSVYPKFLFTWRLQGLQSCQLLSFAMWQQHVATAKQCLSMAG